MKYAPLAALTQLNPIELHASQDLIIQQDSPKSFRFDNLSFVHFWGSL